MSDNEKLMPSSIPCKLSSAENKMYSPCRTVGLKRKSSTPIQKNMFKKSKVTNEIKKCIQFDENIITSKTKTEDKSIPKIYNKNNKSQISLADKQRKIEELKSELRNSEKHSLNEIQQLSEKWLSVCQEALMSLFTQLNQNSNQLTIKDLITNLGIDPNLVNFDPNNQEFY